MTQNRCGNFSIDVEEIYVSGAPVVLRVPIRRCALAERMIAKVGATDHGREIAWRLRIDFTKPIPGPLSPAQGTDEPPPIRSAFGPDLEAIALAECSVQRCAESCSPSYKMLLQQFGYPPDLEVEPDFGCTGRDEPLPRFLQALGE